MAEDALAHWLADQTEPYERSSFSALQSQLSKEQKLVPITVDERLLARYSKTVRVNISLSGNQLEKIDQLAKAQGLNRSEFLVQAALRQEG